MGRRLLRSSLRKPRPARQCKYFCSCCSEERSKPPLRTPFIHDVQLAKRQLKKRKGALKRKQKTALKSKNNVLSTAKVTSKSLDKVGQNLTAVGLQCKSVYIPVARLRKPLLESLSNNGSVCLGEGDSLSNLPKSVKNSGLTNSNKLIGSINSVCEESLCVIDRFRELNADWQTRPHSITDNQSKSSSSGMLPKAVPVGPRVNMETVFLEDRKSSSYESYKENVKVSRGDSDPDVIILDEPRNFQAPSIRVSTPSTSTIRFIPFPQLRPSEPIPTRTGTALKVPAQFQQRNGATRIRTALVNKGQFRSLLNPRETVPTTVAASTASISRPVIVNRQCPNIIKPPTTIRIQPRLHTSDERQILVKPTESPKGTSLNFNEALSNDPLKVGEKSKKLEIIDVEASERSRFRMITKLPSSILKKKSSSEKLGNNSSKSTENLICPRKKMLSAPSSSCMLIRTASNQINGTFNKRNVIQSDKKILTIVLSDSSDDECSLIVTKRDGTKPPAMSIARNSSVTRSVGNKPYGGANAKKIMKNKRSTPASKKNNSRSKSSKTRAKKNVKSGPTKTSKKTSKSCCVGCRIETPRRQKQARGNVTPNDSDSSNNDVMDSDTDPDDPPYSNNGNVSSDPCTTSKRCDPKDSAKLEDAAANISTPHRYQLRSSSLSKKRKPTRKSRDKFKLSGSQMSDTPRADVDSCEEGSDEKVVSIMGKAGTNLITAELNILTEPVESRSKCDDTATEEDAEREPTIVLDDISSAGTQPQRNPEAEDTDSVIAIDENDVEPIDRASGTIEKEREVRDSDSAVNVPENIELQMSYSQNLHVARPSSASCELNLEKTNLSTCSQKLFRPTSNSVGISITCEEESELVPTGQLISLHSNSHSQRTPMTFTEAFIARLYNTKIQDESPPEAAASNAPQRPYGKRTFGERISYPIITIRSSDGVQSSPAPPILSNADVNMKESYRKSGCSGHQLDCNFIDCGPSNEGAMNGLKSPNIVNALCVCVSQEKEKATESTIGLDSEGTHVSVSDTGDSGSFHANSVAVNSCVVQEISPLPVSITNDVIKCECESQEKSVAGESFDLEAFPPEHSQGSIANTGSRCKLQENSIDVHKSNLHEFPSKHFHASPANTDTVGELKKNSILDNVSDLQHCSQVSIDNTDDVYNSQDISKAQGNNSDFQHFPPETIGSLLDFAENEVVFESHGNSIDQISLESLTISQLKSCAFELSSSSEKHGSSLDDVSNSQGHQDIIENSSENNICCAHVRASTGVCTICSQNCMIDKKGDVGESHLSVNIANTDENTVLSESCDPSLKGAARSWSPRNVENCSSQSNLVSSGMHLDDDRAHESQNCYSEIEEMLMSLDLCNITQAQNNQTFACELQNNASLKAFLENGDNTESPKNSHLTQSICVSSDTSNNLDVSGSLSHDPANSFLGDRYESEKDRPPRQTCHKSSEILKISPGMVLPSMSGEAVAPILDFKDSLKSLTSQSNNVGMKSNRANVAVILANEERSKTQDTICSGSINQSIGAPKSIVISSEKYPMTDDGNKTESGQRLLDSSGESNFDADQLEALVEALKVCRQDLTIRKIRPAYLDNADLSSNDGVTLQESDKMCENDLLTVAHELNLSTSFNPRLTIKKLPTSREVDPRSDCTRALYTLTSTKGSSSISASPIKKLNHREISILKFDELVIDNDEPSLNEPPELDRVECKSLNGICFDIRPDRISSIEGYLKRMLGRKTADQDLKRDLGDQCPTPRKRNSPALGSVDEWVIDNDEPPLNPTPIKKARSCLLERTEISEELEDLEIDNDMPPLNESIDKVEDDCLIISSDDEIQEPSQSKSLSAATAPATPAFRPMRKKLMKKRRKVFCSSSEDGSMDERMMSVNNIPNVHAQIEERDPLSWFVNDMIDEVVMDPLMLPADTLPSPQSSREVLYQPQVFNLQGQPLLRFEASNTLMTSNSRHLKAATNSMVTPLNSISSSRVSFDRSHTFEHVQSPESPDSDSDLIILSPNNEITPYSNANCLVNKKNDCNSESAEDSDDDVILLTDNIPNDNHDRRNAAQPIENPSIGCNDLCPPTNANLYLTSPMPLEMRRVGNNDGSSYCVFVIPASTHFSSNSRYPSLF